MTKLDIGKLFGAVLLFSLAMTIAASAQTLTTLAFFNSSDTGASVPLIQGTDGNLYGTTPSAGHSGGGTVYQLSRHGGLTTLHWFSAGCFYIVCPEGYSPAASLVQYPDGNLYGSTVYGGEQLSYARLRDPLPSYTR